MKSFTFATLLASAATLSYAQVIVNPNGTFTCPLPNASYCAGDSLTSNIILRCSDNGMAYAGNCNDNLAGVPPVGVKLSALCYQSSATAGDAACSLDGLVYGPNGTFPINGTTSSSSTTSMTSTTTAPPFPIYNTTQPNPFPTAPVYNVTTSSMASSLTTTVTLVLTVTNCPGCSATLPVSSSIAPPYPITNGTVPVGPTGTGTAVSTSTTSMFTLVTSTPLPVPPTISYRSTSTGVITLTRTLTSTRVNTVTSSSATGAATTGPLSSNDASSMMGARWTKGFAAALAVAVGMMML